MSCYNKEELENMLEDVINELDLSAGMQEVHGQEGTPPAKLVKLVLAQKDRTIRMLKAGMFDAADSSHYPAESRTDEAAKASNGTVVCPWCWRKIVEEESPQLSAEQGTSAQQGQKGDDT